MAVSVLRGLVRKAGLKQEFQIESAVTSAGEGRNLTYLPRSHKQAHQLQNSDYEQYDLLIGMDWADMRSMYRICGGDFAGKMHLLVDFTDHSGGKADSQNTDDVEVIRRDVEAGCLGLLDYLIKEGTINDCKV